MNSFTAALINIRRSPYQSLAAILILSLTFFVGYAFSLFILGSEQVLRYFETRPQVIAFFAIDAPTEAVNNTITSMKEKPYVTDIKAVSKEDALKIYQEENKDDPLLLELVTSQILPASLEISGQTIADLPKIKKDLEQINSVEEVVLQQDIIDSLSSWTTTIRMVGLACVVVLSVTSLLIMVIVIGMKVVGKRPAINIMRIIGASRWFIKSPFVFEGVIYGLISSLIGWLSTMGGLLYLMPWLQNFLGPVPIFPIPPALYALQLSIGTLLSMLLGAAAGSIAVSRLIKK